MSRKRISQVLFVFSIILSLTLASCGGGGFSLFATETPTPTLTFTPTATFTPSPTPTVTQTPSPTETPRSVELQEQADGSSLLIDYEHKYQLSFSSNWVAAAVSKDTLNEAIDSLATKKPELADAAEGFRQIDANTARLLALTTNPEFLTGGGIPNIIITAFRDGSLATMELSAVIELLEEGTRQQGLTIITEGVNTIENANGVDVQYIDATLTVGENTVIQRIMLFQTEEKLIMVTFTTPEEFSEAIFAETELTGASIELLK